MHTTASYCHKLKVHWKWLNVSAVLSCPGLRSLLEKKKTKNTFSTLKWTLHILSSFIVTWNTMFKTPPKHFWGTWTLIQLISLNGVPTFQFCYTFWAHYWGHHYTSAPNSLAYFGSLTSFINHGRCSKPSQWFIIPTCLGFVSFTLFCKRIILVLLF